MEHGHKVEKLDGCTVEFFWPDISSRDDESDEPEGSARPVVCQVSIHTPGEILVFEQRSSLTYARTKWR